MHPLIAIATAIKFLLPEALFDTQWHNASAIAIFRWLRCDREGELVHGQADKVETKN